MTRKPTEAGSFEVTEILASDDPECSCVLGHVRAGAVHLGDALVLPVNSSLALLADVERIEPADDGRLSLTIRDGALWDPLVDPGEVLAVWR